jgi:hypothetical protein
MGRFDVEFSSIVGFYPNGFHLSRKQFTKEEASKIFAREMLLKDDEVLPAMLKEKFVRWQTTPSELREEGMPDMGWMVCGKNDKNAQPTWEYDPTESCNE